MTRHAEHGNMIQGQNLCLISQNMTEMMGSTDSSNNLHSFSSVRVCWDYLLPYCTQFLTCIGNVTQWETLCTQSDRTIHWHMIIWATERMRGPRANTKSGMHNIDCVREVSEHSPRKFWDFTCSEVCSGGF